jgi:hypothetical protein
MEKANYRFTPEDVKKSIEKKLEQKERSVYSFIRTCIENDETSTTFFHEFHPRIKQHLIEDGFTLLDEFDEKNPTLHLRTIVSW